MRKDRGVWAYFLTLFSLLGILGCQGGGGGGPALTLVQSNVAPGQVIAINQPLKFTFDKKIDLDTVNLNTFIIEPAAQTNLGGPIPGPVSGTFTLENEGRTLVFQPLCPDASNSAGEGFVPSNEIGNAVYNIRIPSSQDALGTVLQAEDLSSLPVTFSLLLQTKPETSPYVDLVPGPPTPMNTDELPPTLGLNLNSSGSINPILLKLDQSIDIQNIDIGNSVFLFYEDPNLGDIPIPTVTTLLNNCHDGEGAQIEILPIGILPAGGNIRFELSKEVNGLGLNDKNPENLVFHTALVEQNISIPQLDVIGENFIDDVNFDPKANLLIPFASWKDGKLEAIPTLPSLVANSTIEIGPGTTNTGDILFNTDGGYLRDTSGLELFFANGVISVKRFIVKAGGAIKGTGSNPLIIRTSELFEIEEGGNLNVNGQNAPSVFGINVANQTSPPGEGRCGGGDGGWASSNTVASTKKGDNGKGAFNFGENGGEGGHSSFGKNGSPDNLSGTNKQTIPGGGGGGNWGIYEKDESGLWQSFCYGTERWVTDCESIGDFPCKGPAEVLNTQGEKGGNGVKNALIKYCQVYLDYVSHLDAVTGLCLAQGGEPGYSPFEDSDMENNFWGRKPFGNEVIEGELKQFQGGSGGGGGGDNVPSIVFPSNNYISLDMRGAGGGGGAGVVYIQSLGTIRIDGRLFANGGTGGQGEQLSPGENGSGGGGGGAGGMIILESPTKIFIGNTAKIFARGGNRGRGGGKAPWPTFPTGQFADCRRNWNSARGGAGGKGIIQFHVPFDSTQMASNYGVDTPIVEAGTLQVEKPGGAIVNIASEQDMSIAGNNSEQETIAQLFDPPPYLGILNIGPHSGAQSRWFYTGTAYLGTGAVSNPPEFAFRGTNETTGILEPSFQEILYVGNQASFNAEGNQIIINDPNAISEFESAPQVLIDDTFVPSPSNLSYPILNAFIQNETLVLDIDTEEHGPITTLGQWTILRQYWKTLVNGGELNYPSTATATILFEGAQPQGPGSLVPDETTFTGFTADINSLKGNSLIRFQVLFNSGAGNTVLNPSLPRPGIKFIRIPMQY